MHGVNVHMPLRLEAHEHGDELAPAECPFELHSRIRNHVEDA